jgi:hypothetical protein
MVDETREAFATESERDAYDVGLSRGWTHGNFVAAYVREHDRRTPDYPGWLSEGDQATRCGGNITSMQRRADRAAFQTGWSEGRKRFARGRYEDGSKIDG